MKEKTLYNLLYLCIFISFKINAGFFKQNSQGWHWYNDPIIALKEHEAFKNLELLTPTEQVKAYSKMLEEKLHRAWVNPSISNIMAYQKMQKDLMQRSEFFSRIWMKSLYLNPQLDHTLIFPVNQKARHVYLDQQEKLYINILQKLKNTHGLFFFFRGGCQYCEEFAKIVQEFAKNANWEVLAISTDGHRISGFKDTIIDNKLIKKWNIKGLPALFAVNPSNNQFLPIAVGLISLDEIENRILTLVENVGS